jgi:hypothetical protein
MIWMTKTFSFYKYNIPRYGPKVETNEKFGWPNDIMNGPCFGTTRNFMSAIYHFYSFGFSAPRGICNTTPQ